MKKFHEWVTKIVQQYTKPSHFMLGQIFYLLTFWWMPYPIVVLFILASIKEAWDWFNLAGHPFMKESIINFIKTEWWFDTGWYILGTLPIYFIGGYHG